MMEHGPSAEPSIDPFELSTTLARLGLSQYEERLRENAFEDWENLTAITETDMKELGFKLGDRRKLQRAIREHGRSSASPVDYGGRNLPLSSEGLQQATRTTRAYRRHPRPDANAPNKPKTAYVLFGEHVRQDPALSQSSFTAFAKETGKRWRELSDEERVRTWETSATDRLKEYREELERYKQTENYRSYRTYLESFKQRRLNPEWTILTADKTLSSPESVSVNQPPASQDPEEAESTRRESGGTEDLDLEDQSQDRTSHITSGFEEMRHISNLKGWPQEMTPLIMSRMEGVRDIPNSEGLSQDTTSPVTSGMEEVRHVSNALGINPHLTRVAAFPLEDMTTKAVEAFLHGTGSLLYLWNQDEALDLVKSVYHPQSESTPVHATEVFAMSAVGCYCDGESHTMLLQEKFLQFFLYMLSSPSDMSDLQRMRLFACLAICRFINSVESARRLMLSALSIGRQTFASPSFGADTPDEKVAYWRNVFRSVVFLESWFAYNTSHESRITRQDLTFIHPSRSYADRWPGNLQERVSKLGELAAYITLDLKTAAQPRVSQARVHFESLNEWHRTLPPPMQLSRLSLADPLTLNWHTKRSLLQLHILFLGLFIEPYRNCLVDIGKLRVSNTQTEMEDLETLKNVEEQCVLAARQSARVASLLQTNNLIRSHCWVSVYTSFTGCTVLLFSASQKLLELFGEEIGQDLSYASSHLNALSLCSYNNAMARKLYTTLQIIYSDIREVVVSPVYRTMRDLHIVVKDVALAPLLHYDAVEGVEELRKTILDLARRIMGVLQESVNF